MLNLNIPHSFSIFSLLFLGFPNFPNFHHHLLTVNFFHLSPARFRVAEFRMEAPIDIGMEESKKLEEAKLTSAAAFVEGGIQDACDDSCSICLEDFKSDPAAVTVCKHEFHLQCILEWCQRSSQCPMCWQPIGLKDPTSQELLDAVVEERNARLNPPTNTAIFHHPALGDFEIQHLPVGVHESELEERIIQRLAAAAAMGRARHFARREGHRVRSSSAHQGRPQFLVFSGHPDSQAGRLSHPDGGQAENTPASSVVMPSSSLVTEGEASQYVSPSNNSRHRNTVSSSGFSALSSGPNSSPSSSGSPNQSSPRRQDTAGPSDLQSFSETLKSRLNTMSTRYKESISKSTRGWKEKWFSRNSPMSDIGSDVRREVNTGIATVSRMIERLETRDDGRSSSESVPNNSLETSPARDQGPHRGTNSVSSPVENGLSENRTQAPCATSTTSE